MKIMMSLVGLILSVVFFVLSMVWMPAAIYEQGTAIEHFMAICATAVFINVPFVFANFATHSARSYPLIVGFFFTAIGALAAVGAFIALFYGMSMTAYWSLHLVVWAVALMLVLFAFMSAGMNKSNT
jgi:hypothetical protein